VLDGPLAKLALSPTEVSMDHIEALELVFRVCEEGEASMAEDIEVTQGNTVVAPTGSAHCTWVALPRRTTIG
jgi:hypothetical protein